MVPESRPVAIACGISAGKGEANVFDELSFQIPPASFTALVGANGSGKTTLFETLLGLVDLRGGTLEVLGESPHAARTKVAYVPQSSQRAHDGQFIGREFVAAAYCGNRWGMTLNRRAEQNAVERALRQVDAEPLAGTKLSRLSGGQRQRLLVAQALVNEPQLIFMDEPLAQLDPAAQDQIVGLAARLRDELGVAVLFSTHDVNPLVGIVDRVLYLAHGRGCIGTVDEVVTDEVLSGLYGVPMHVVRDRAGLLVTRDRTLPSVGGRLESIAVARLPIDLMKNTPASTQPSDTRLSA